MTPIIQNWGYLVIGLKQRQDFGSFLLEKGKGAYKYLIVRLPSVIETHRVFLKKELDNI